MLTILCPNCEVTKPVTDFKVSSKTGCPSSYCIKCRTATHARRLHRFNTRGPTRDTTRCPTCNVIKPEIEFTTTRGHSMYCTVCRHGRRKAKQRIANLNTVQRAYRRQQTHARRTRVQAIAKEVIANFRKNGCFLCAEAEPCCLAAHHTDPTTKEYSVAKLAGGEYNLQLLVNELSKCICLCHNCHVKLHAGKILLPAQSAVAG